MKFFLLEDFSDYNQFPKFPQIDDRLHVNERFSIIIDHRNNTIYRSNTLETLLFQINLVSVILKKLSEGTFSLVVAHIDLLF